MKKEETDYRLQYIKFTAENTAGTGNFWQDNLKGLMRKNKGAFDEIREKDDK